MLQCERAQSMCVCYRTTRAKSVQSFSCRVMADCDSSPAKGSRLDQNGSNNSKKSEFTFTEGLTFEQL